MHTFPDIWGLYFPFSLPPFVGVADAADELLLFEWLLRRARHFNPFTFVMYRFLRACGVRTSSLYIFFSH